MTARKSPITALLLLTACGGDGSGPGDTGLTREEAAAVATFVLQAGEDATTGVGDATSSAAPITFELSHESSHPCPSGGTLALDIAVQGSFDAETRSASFDVQGTQTHTACAFPHEGVTIVVDGDPAISFAASAAATGGEPSEPYVFDLGGGFRFDTSDGRSGTCALSLHAVTDFAARTRTVQGEVCGHTIDQTITWG